MTITREPVRTPVLVLSRAPVGALDRALRPGDLTGGAAPMVVSRPVLLDVLRPTRRRQ
jgi:hypothetical protein